jgi:gamma-glutamylcyclotransferase (GGCT)/AIG2-like uncharacterized protein YtfP
MVRQVFVYGSLMRGEAHHERLAGARFLGAARTPPAYTLVSLGEYPALVAGGGTCVEGELYAVDADTLAALDRFEEHPDLYRRTAIALESGARAWAYLLAAPRGGEPPIASGRWRERGVSR